MAGAWPGAVPRGQSVALLVITLCFCLQDLRSTQAQTLDSIEVEALKKIAEKLKIPTTLWNFTVDPCRWVPWNRTKLVVSNLTCGDCNATTNVCHVVNISSSEVVTRLFFRHVPKPFVCSELKGQNLTGVLPEEFGNLTSLAQIDLTRNYINGSIPAAAWTSLPLVNLSLIVNRLSGRIPDAIGKITTLQVLTLDSNRLQGPLPPSLGNLKNLTRLLISANNFTGELPETLGRLENLTDLRIDGNDISGKIPSFIGNWTKLGRLEMQGTSLEGPFPPSFSLLRNITELRITDLKKSDGSFPDISNMKNIKYLVLRNCSLSGQIPGYIGTMPELKNLDLSFNNLTGPIPDGGGFTSLEYMYGYLTNNRLTGSINPALIQSPTIKKLDVSYNNFNYTPQHCRTGEKNFVASFSSTQDPSIPSCLRKDLPCDVKPKSGSKNYQLFINCGGPKVTVDNNQYEEDSEGGAKSAYFQSNSGNWAFSNTGDFVGNDKAPYIAENTSMLRMRNPELYTKARLNPLSLKYYGLCMQKGNYTVKLQFAEIVFTSDQTFKSLGRRFFDVSIQGKKVLTDFNIAVAANGTGKEIVKNFIAPVDKGTLEIHFQWLGKGTNAIPDRGSYGPLISAISVIPADFTPELDEEKKKLSIGAIVGIAVASSVLAMLILLSVWFFQRRKRLENNGLRGLELHTSCFSYKQIKAATRNFDPSNKIGEGGFGPVYKGALPDGSQIAVKQLSSKSKQGNREFVNEIGMISALQHPNLVRLLGCCIEGKQLLLVYEYMEKNSLARALFGPEDVKLKLDWQTRRKICLDVARGLAYLHEESTLKIVHRDIKATNILLDKDLNAKISDFGLAKLDEEDNTHISTRIAGTMGYMAPEYATRGYLTDKADVYSFGVVILETVSGRCNTKYRPKEELIYLLDWAYELQEQGSLLELVDPELGTNYPVEEALQMLNLALVCTKPTPTLRPAMSTVVSMLEGHTPVEVSSVLEEEHGRQGSAQYSRVKSLQEKLSDDSEKKSISTDAPWTGSSASMPSSKADVIFYSSASQLLSDYE
ncbi:hypothetical protein Taro_028137 [Colocasia esculenta]|uniref:non-specific serine/threonine protein kinase n=1 Tax=Colocasia esculenta TaxID=4460 RepID=A0A843VFQ6_COLES|nr:hypothetical protein [Colocasia esculenta]